MICSKQPAIVISNPFKQLLPIHVLSSQQRLKQPATTDSSKQWSEGFSVGEFMLFQYVVDNFLVA